MTGPFKEIERFIYRGAHFNLEEEQYSNTKP
jgi:hypothetical protein